MRTFAGAHFCVANNSQKITRDDVKLQSNTGIITPVLRLSGNSNPSVTTLSTAIQKYYNRCGFHKESMCMCAFSTCALCVATQVVQHMCIHTDTHTHTHRHTHGFCKETTRTQEWAVAQAWVLKRMLGYIRTVLKKE